MKYQTFEIIKFLADFNCNKKTLSIKLLNKEKSR